MQPDSTPANDADSEEGRVFYAHEQEAVRIWTAHNPSWRYVETRRDENSVIDGLLVTDIDSDTSVLRALVEFKVRDMSLHQLMGEFGGEWLITESKIVRAAETARFCCVPLVGFLYLIPDRLLLTQQLAGKDGAAVDRRIEKSYTQNTCRDYTKVERVNAYIQMRDAKQWRSVGGERGVPASPR